jgi:hypothetical protein
MGSDDRFYLMEMRNRPVLYGDIGSLIRIEGLVVGGGGNEKAILMLPDISPPSGIYPAGTKLPIMTAEDWSDFIRRSDDPEILVGLPKIFQRKLRYEISGAIQQKIWAADGFKCIYCGVKMGDRLMTIDHFIPLELGGKNDVTNYLTACKKCNKDKGSQDPKEWILSKEWEAENLYQHLVEYLERRVIK